MKGYNPITQDVSALIKLELINNVQGIGPRTLSITKSIDQDGNAHYVVYYELPGGDQNHGIMAVYEDNVFRPAAQGAQWFQNAVNNFVNQGYQTNTVSSTITWWRGALQSASGSSYDARRHSF
jgi:hypothetical protein